MTSQDLSTKKTAAKKVATKKTATKKTATKKIAAAPKKVAASKSKQIAAADADPTTDDDVVPSDDGVEDFGGAFGEDLWDEDWSDLGSFAADPDGPDSNAGDPARQWAADRVEVFQHAALELIAAARTALDTAEELIADPQAIGTALESLKDIAGEMMRSARPGPRPTAGPEATDFQSIRVEDD